MELIVSFFWYTHDGRTETFCYILYKQTYHKKELPLKQNLKNPRSKKNQKIELATGVAWVYVYAAKPNVNFCLRWSVKEKWVAVGPALLVKRMSMCLMNTHAKPASSAPGPTKTSQVNALWLCLCCQWKSSSAELRKQMPDTREYEDCFGQIELSDKADIWTAAGICFLLSSWLRNHWCNSAAF